MLFTIAQPVWDGDVGDTIEAFRATHDPQHQVLAAHFTLAFGMTVDLAAWLSHVQAVAAHTPAFRFALRHAMLFAPDKGRAHVFLVPDEGASQIAKLHGCLLSGNWAAYRRLDIPYIPHATIAVSDSAEEAQSWVDDWNSQPFALCGRVDALSVGEVRDGRFVTVASESLRSSS